ncbi:MAG TPA: hypothetical protein VF221_05015 [Chloroflexota bacterium]
MTTSRGLFDPYRVATYEAQGWRAYYEHAWLRVIRLVVQLTRQQFRVPLPQAILGAYFIARAEYAWIPQDHDERTVQTYLERYYALVDRYSHFRFDPAEAARQELRCWEVHRRVSGKADKREFVDVMMDLHSVVFGITRDQARESAKERVLANTVVDGITSGALTDLPSAWKATEEHLRCCYRSIDRELGIWITGG